MATSSQTRVGIDVSKDRLDVAVLGKERVWQVDNTREGIARLVQQREELQPELIVVEALFWAGVAVVNPAPMRQFARACGFLAKTDKLDAQVQHDLKCDRARPAVFPHLILSRFQPNRKR